MAIVQLDINNVNYFVDQSLKPVDKRITSLKSEQTEVQSVQSMYGAVRTELSKLSALATDATIESKLMPGKALTSDATVSDVTIGAGAVASTYTLAVGALADAHTAASSAWTGANTDLITAEGAGTRSFRMTIGGSAVDVSVALVAGDTNQTVLEKVRDAVNAASNNVVASLIHETSGASTFVVQSRKSGVAQRMTWSDQSGTLMKSMGLLDAGGALARVLATGNDASITLNGTLTLTSATNQFADALPGVTLDLHKIGSTTLTVSTDAKATVDKMQAFVDAYNSAIKKIRSALDEKPVAGKAGTGLLYRDRLLQSIANSLRETMLTVPEGGVLGLGDLGIAPVNSITDATLSGQLKVDRTVLENALASNPRSVLSAFTDATNGIGARFQKAIKEFSDLDNGSLTLKIASGDSRLEKVKALLKQNSDQRTKRATALTRRYNGMVVQQQKMTGQLQFINGLKGA
jgi:flagellar hook-associated protein 2